MLSSLVMSGDRDLWIFEAMAASPCIAGGSARLSQASAPVSEPLTMKTSYDIKSRNNLSYDCFYVAFSHEGFGIVPLGSFALLRVKVDRIEAGLLTKGSPVRDGEGPLPQTDQTLAAQRTSIWTTAYKNPLPE
jgi:hypothetical protein